MASSRKSRSSEAHGLGGRVARALEPALRPGAQVLLGLSGGVDSIVLLDILAGLAPGLGFSLRVLHVNHGLSPNAEAWARFCGEACARRQVPFAVDKADVARFAHLGREGAARAARYQAFARHAADCLALAHQRDDQAETLLLQLLRGAGPAGLSGMGAWHAGARGERPVLRPLLGTSRAEVEAYALERALEWIEDESNADTALARNFVRHRLLPEIEARFPGARERIARSAAHAAEAAELLHELGRADLERLAPGGGVELAALRALGSARARNALRSLCRLAGAPPPGLARLAELWRQLEQSRADAQPRMALAGWVFRRYRGRVYLEREPTQPLPASWCVRWRGEASLPLPELGGVLRFERQEGHGLGADKLAAAPVTVRLRRGGERLRPDSQRPTRTLKHLLQENALPPWRRERLPLLYCGGTLVCVPGIGEEYDWQARAGEAGVVVHWEPGHTSVTKP